MRDTHPSVSTRLLATLSDDRLLSLAGRGHEQAFEALVRRHRKPLLASARRLLPPSRAEDAVQQGLLYAWTALQRGTEVREVRAWLYRIVHNAALRMLSAPGYDCAELTDSMAASDTPATCVERKAALRQAVAGVVGLPPLQRAALVQTSIEGRSHDQVAATLGLSDTAVRGLVYRARTALRAAAGALTPWPLVARLERLLRGESSLGGRLSRSGMGVGGGGAVTAIAKGGAIVVTAGILAAGSVAVRSGLSTSRSRTDTSRVPTSAAPEASQAIAATGDAATAARASLPGASHPASRRSTTAPWRTPNRVAAPSLQTVEHAVAGAPANGASESPATLRGTSGERSSPTRAEAAATAAGGSSEGDGGSAKEAEGADAHEASPSPTGSGSEEADGGSSHPSAAGAGGAEGTGGSESTSGSSDGEPTTEPN